MKKVFHILFCFYFIALVFVPCGDKDDCNEINHSSVSQTSNHEEHSGEVCTPFCACSCCAAHFLTSAFEPSYCEIAPINRVYTIQKESKISTAIIPIWQPPKLV